VQQSVHSAAGVVRDHEALARFVRHEDWVDENGRLTPATSRSAETVLAFASSIAIEPTMVA
jgi:hypothetical protein